MKPRLTKERIKQLDTIISPLLRYDYLFPFTEDFRNLCHYASIAIHLEEYNPELFNIIEKVLKKEEK